MLAKQYGMECIIDLYDCNPLQFNRKSLKKFFKELCDIIDMTRCDLHFWDDVGVSKEEKQTSPHTKGTSAVQFILTSNITIHTLDLLREVYINIFSCKIFDEDIASDFSARWFQGKIRQKTKIERGAR